ncbi:MerR family transcriptional regulator [Streptomyces millisiae]|uniref:MerR family transcriptional regulator n=1 Tax=Streptomyces millisiae TaxID=3075542 RepID=A0ABU2LQ40_9ACTN|nr:MerR family transcriptional regulator [Streptomyces sp. DSM 44918]MDT0319719.1 MerR family transcriptional regulator [Streptomyces sp. DSM 44918]
MRIGELASRANVSTRALRYYEQQGILVSERTPSGQRVYPDSAVERVRLIQQFYAAGLSSRTIAMILPCVDTGHAQAEALERLRAERARIAAAVGELQEAGRKLDRVIELAEHPDPAYCPSLREQPAERQTASV